jgi:hypothetical protein
LPQLGLGDTNNRFTPTRISALVNSTVVVATAGAVSVQFFVVGLWGVRISKVGQF